MNCYEKMVSAAEAQGFYVVEKHFKSSAKGLCKGNKIGISKSIETNVEKRCVLAEEISHAIHTVGNILDQNEVSNVKQENFARKQAYEALLPLSALIEAYQQGYRSQFEIAEYLEVTEEFLLDSLYHYQNKHGLIARYGGYIIYFSPLVISKLKVTTK